MADRQVALGDQGDAPTKLATALAGAGRCDLTELPTSMCAHCLGHDNPPAQTEQPASDLGPWFTARHQGRCSECAGYIEPGDRIRADGDGGYLAECCGEDDHHG